MSAKLNLIRQIDQLIANQIPYISVNPESVHCQKEKSLPEKTLPPDVAQQQINSPIQRELDSNKKVEFERCVIAGSFNPLHRGHLEMAKLAALRTAIPTMFELSINNADKTHIGHEEILDRIDQPYDAPLLITKQGNFVEKSRAFPRTIFAVGADTLIRIAESKFYDQYSIQPDAAFQLIKEFRCGFLVFGRTLDGQFKELNDLAIPPSLRALCFAVSESEFRFDLSSTEIRKAGKQ